MALVFWKLFGIFGHMNTTFRDIPGFEGYYQVDNVPNIRSIPRNGTSKNGRILKQFLRRGYLCVYLAKDGVNKMCPVSVLVAKAFPEICGVWFEGCQVHHKDGNRINNNPNNLIVCTKEQHNLYHIEMGKCVGEKNPFYGKHHTEETRKHFSQIHTGMRYSDEVNKKKASEQLKGGDNQLSKITVQFSLNNQLIKIWDCTNTAALTLGINQGAISNCCLMKAKTAGNKEERFKWSRIHKSIIQLDDAPCEFYTTYCLIPI